MKRSLKFLSMALLVSGMVFMSACSDDEGGGGNNEAPPSLIKKITFDPSYDAPETYEFTYDDQDRVTSIENIYDGGDPEMITFNYSVANKVTVNKGGSISTRTLDSEGRVISGRPLYGGAPEDEYFVYEYDEDGFISKVFEHYDGEDHLKFELDTENGNVTKHTRYGDDGVTANRVKTFFFTPGNNESAIPQENVIDSNWEAVGGLYGKRNKKLVDKLEYYNTADPTEVFTTTITYTFDEKNRPATITRTGDGFTEVYTYEYYEDEN